MVARKRTIRDPAEKAESICWGKKMLQLINISLFYLRHIE